MFSERVDVLSEQNIAKLVFDTWRLTAVVNRRRRATKKYRKKLK
jgi:hypothetical protein